MCILQREFFYQDNIGRRSVGGNERSTNLNKLSVGVDIIEHTELWLNTCL